MSAWSDEDPGVGDLEEIAKMAGLLEFDAERASEMVSSGRTGLETLEGVWSGETSTAARARFTYLLDALKVMGEVCRVRGESLRSYAADVQGIKLEAAPFIKKRDEGKADMERLVPAVGRQREVVVSKGGVAPSLNQRPSAPLFGPFVPGTLEAEQQKLGMLENELSDARVAVRSNEEALVSLGNARRAFDQRLVSEMEWVAPEGSPSGEVYTSYVAAVKAGMAPPATVQEATVLGVKVANGKASDAEKAAYGAWMMMFSKDREVMTSIAQSLGEKGVDVKGFVDSITGDDPASQSIRDGWTAGIAAHSDDPTFSAVFMGLLGPEGVDYLYDRIARAKPEVLEPSKPGGPGEPGEPGDPVPVIEPGGSSKNRDFQLNALGGAVAASFATASCQPPGDFNSKPVPRSWAYGADGGATVGRNRNTASTLFYYTNRGGYEIGGETLKAAGHALMESDKRYAEMGMGIGHPGPWFNMDDPTSPAASPDVMYWWGMASAVSSEGSQTVLLDQELREYLLGGKGGVAHRGDMVEALVNCGVVSQAMGGPGGDEGAKRAAQIADLIVDYVGGKPSDYHGDGDGNGGWDPVDNPLNKEVRQAVANIMAAYMPDVYYGYENTTEMEILEGKEREDRGYYTDKWPPYSISINSQIYDTVLAKIGGDEGARNTVLGGVRSFVSDVMRQGQSIGFDPPGVDREGSFNTDAQHLTSFSTNVVDTIVDATVSDEEARGAVKNKLYTVVSSGAKFGAGFGGKPGMATATIIDLILSDQLSASIDEDMDTVIRDGKGIEADAMNANKAMIIHAYVDHPDLDPKAREWIQTHVFPKDNPNRPIGEYTKADWDRFNLALRDEVKDSNMSNEAVEQLQELLDETTLGELAGRKR